ncbi:MAG: sugar transferase [Clostridia bacterium]|nr:sugar transferase [Clostridia bacterium]
MKISEEDIRETIEDRIIYDNVTVLYLFSKRIFDIAASFFALLLLSPVFLGIWILIKVDSEGSVIFKQERVGHKGKIFKMYKFRSMIVNAEEHLERLEKKNEISGYMFKIKEDPRVTRIGRFIRKTSIDELPQLINVLKGDMSLVGPRPPLPREVIRYDRWHNLRMSVKPGITGLWQVSGRNKLGFDEMVRLDLKYIRERNFCYDIKIIFRTIPVLFGDRHAF